MKLSIDLLFRVAAIGLVMALASTILKSAGREDMAMLCSVGGLILAMMLVAQGILDLFSMVRDLFPLYG